jgi:hypothetical protein
MIAIASQMHPMLRISLEPVLAAITRAARVLREPSLQCVHTKPGRSPSIPTFIVYDLPDVIGASRR